jgi:hypothetical protein
MIALTLSHHAASSHALRKLNAVGILPLALERRPRRIFDVSAETDESVALEVDRATLRGQLPPAHTT